MDLRKILKLSLLVGETVRVRVDDIALDGDGVPSSVGESIEYDDVEVLGVLVTASQLARHGLKPTDIPGLTVIDDPHTIQGENNA